MIAITRPVNRRVVSIRGHDYVVRLAPEGVYIREKRARSWYGPLDYGWLHTQGARLEADAIVREKQRQKAARKLTR